MLLFVEPRGQGAGDRLLTLIADRLIADGYRLGGIVQSNVACAAGGPCDMDVRVLPQGPVYRISQSLGPGARGCRLDPAALEAAVAQVEARWESGLDLLIVNKFGKQEAAGRGFRDLIARAVAVDVPVLVGVNERNRHAFSDFAEDLGRSAPAEFEPLLACVRGVLANEIA